MYGIVGLNPRTDITMGAHGFSVCLHPEFRECVKRSGITQEMVNLKLQQDGPEWLKACGFEPDLFMCKLRVDWQEWGPHHITVPGNACGLDIDKHGFSLLFKGGVSLHPHNIDSWRQKQLLLIAFTSFAEDVLILGRLSKD